MRRPRVRNTRRLVVVGVVVVVAAAAGTSAWALTRPTGPSYRTAPVARGTVSQTITTTGELSPMHYADDDFQVAGKVAKVTVKTGDHVAAGTVLAHLHRTTLKATLRSAKAELTSARDRLQEDESGEASLAAASRTTAATDVSYRAATATASPQPKPSGSSGGSGSGPSGSGGTGSHHAPVTTATLRADQRAVVRAQQASDRALADAKVALKTESTACAAEAGSSSGGASPASGSTLTCTQAAKALLNDQQAVSADENAVDQAEQVLSGDLATVEKSLKSKGSSGSRSTSSKSGAQSAVGGSTSTVTAADLASDQASIDTGRAQVATAKSDLAQATLRATISGTVGAVTIGKGDSVSGSSSSTSPAVEIIGSHQDKATVYVSDTQVRRMKLGQTARITPDGTSRAVTGRVVTIGVSGTESDSGSITYPVTLDVADPSSALVAGADAAVSITLATASNVVAVATSAVHYQGSTAYVDLLRNGKSVRHTIKVGAVGPALTQVTSGLSVGQHVILANLNASVPSSSSTLTGRFGQGGFPVGNFSIRRVGSGGPTKQGTFTQNVAP